MTETSAAKKTYADTASGKESKLNAASVTGKILMEGTLVLDSPLLIGTGLMKDGARNEVDTQILKDRHERPFIPGTSLAGVLRSLLPEETAELLFGKIVRGKKADDSWQSAVDIEDVKLEGASIVLRDGVGIAAYAGTALKGRKYNYEAVERGAKGRLRMTVTRRMKQEEKGDIEEAVKKLTDWLAGGIRVGALTSKGFGKISVSDVKASFYDFRDFADVRRWLLREAAEKSYAGQKSSGRRAPGIFSVDASFAVRGSLIVRENNVDANDKIKARQKKSGADFLLPGTSLKGVLRHRAEEILDILKKPAGMLDGLMGCSRESGGQKSRFLVDETYFRDGVKAAAHARNRIDCFTGGTVDSVLFTEEPVWQKEKGTPTLSLHYEIRDYAPWEAGLALYLLRDLWQGNIAVGGESSVGRGRLAGISATISLGEESCTLGAGGEITGDGAAKLEACAKALRDYEEKEEEGA